MMGLLRTIARVVALGLAMLVSPAHEASASESLRVVSLGAAVTETVVALGAGDQVVGFDSTSRGILPKEGVEELGFYKRITATGVLSLRANLVLATHDAGFPATFEQLRRTNVEVVRLEKVESAESAIAQITQVAAALGRGQQGRALIADIRRDLARLAARRERASHSPKMLFIYARGAGAMLVGGRQTTADAMIDLLGGINVAAAFEGFRPFSPEVLLAQKPAVLMLARHGFEALGQAEGLKAHPALSKTPAVRNGAVVVEDARDLLSFGPRFAARALNLAQRIDRLVVAGERSN